MTPEEGRRMVILKDAAVQHFGASDWLELGAVTGRIDQVRNHDRLLRSLSWNDADYGLHAMAMLASMVAHDPVNLEVISHFIEERFEFGGTNVSSVDPSGRRRVYFSPTVFEVPDGAPERDLLSAMMPFGPAFAPVHAAIRAAAQRNGMRCLRADDIWDQSTVIQDVFALIFRSQIIVCDFTGKNANVFYEAGIAHTLGKHVIPITQHASDIPFDLQSHRYLPYLNNAEGHARLTEGLSDRVATLMASTQRRSR